MPPHNAVDGRDDISRFLVHFTRDYEGTKAIDNLINILSSRTIKARNAHCLFNYKFDQLNFSNLLKKKFNSVCFTETPFSQLRYLLKEIPRRQIVLKPYGLIFWRSELLNKGASHAIYIANYNDKINQYLIRTFNKQFDGVSQYKILRSTERYYYKEIIKYFSLINKMSERYDFSWEREWRHVGDFSFRYSNLVAIIADEPESFTEKLNDTLTGRRYQELKKIPIISPYWNIEQVVEQFSYKIWD